MKIKHDPVADAVYIYLSNKPYAYGKDLDDRRRIDFASDNTPIGIELLSVSKGVDPEDLPEQEQITDILERKNFRILV